MIKWTIDELKKVGAANELQIASLRQNSTLRNRVTIWVVRVGDDLYVRSYNGPDGTWYRRLLVSHEGRIWAGGVEKDVTFVELSDPDINNQIDTAYLTKYGRSQFVTPMVSPEVRATTLKLVPR